MIARAAPEWGACASASAPRSPSKLRRFEFYFLSFLICAPARSRVAARRREGAVGHGMADPLPRMDWTPTPRAWKRVLKISKIKNPEGPRIWSAPTLLIASHRAALSPALRSIVPGFEPLAGHDNSETYRVRPQPWFFGVRTDINWNCHDNRCRHHCDP